MGLVVTSPPYNIGKEYETSVDRATWLSQQSSLIEECVRAVSDTGSICWQVGHQVINGEVMPLDILLYPLFKSAGLKLRGRIVWTFGHGLHCQRRFSGRHETILWFTKSNQYTFHLDPVRVPSKYPQKKHFKGAHKGRLSGNPLGKNPSDVWDIPNVKSNHVEKVEHPCQFPVALVERLVLSLTNAGDIVFDPYVGVGSTAIAALKNGRRVVGSDISEHYLAQAHERLRLLSEGALRTRDASPPTYKQ